MPERNVEGDYRYAFQGQEKDPETGKEAFELRLWDARIGRWLTTDPAGQYSSPYLGMGNNPINGVDPDGGTFFNRYKKDITTGETTLINNDGGDTTDYIELVSGDFSYGTIVENVQTINQNINLPYSEVAPSETFTQRIPGAIVNTTFQAGASGALHDPSAELFVDYAVGLGVGKVLKWGGSLLRKSSDEVIEGIYQFEAASGKIYVGQSVNIPQRIAQHIKSGKLPALGSYSSTEVLGGKTAREIAEQMRINSLGGVRVLDNIRNPIGASRRYLLDRL